MKYFSYGSNMSVRRLQQRVPSATALGVARLSEHRLMFHKVSDVDGSAKCDACHTGKGHHEVIGVLYEMHEQHKPALDRVEGVGYGYEEKTVNVELTDGSVMQAFTYCATLTDANLKPFHWYKRHVVIGAREHGLPAEYIENIHAIESIADSDLQRHELELSIYDD